jgi:hypothetical protein
VEVLEKLENPDFDKILHRFFHFLSDFGIFQVLAVSLLASLDLIWDAGDSGKIGKSEKKGRKRAKMTPPKSVTMSGLWGWPDSGKSGKRPKKGQNLAKKGPKTLTSEGQNQWFWRVKIRGFGGRKPAKEAKNPLLGAKTQKSVSGGQKRPKSAKNGKNGKSDPNLFCEH